MNKKLQEKIYKRFDPIFEDRHKSMRETCMCWGISTGDGWFDLIWKLCEDIEKNLSPEEKKEFRAVQVKEKFGGLRFYTNGSNDKIQDIIHKAEMNSCEVCESCGKPGKQRAGGWVHTLCDACEKAYNKDDTWPRPDTYKKEN